MPNMAKRKSKAKIKKRTKKAKKEEIEETSETFRKECRECGSTNVVFMSSTSQTVCQDCGAIFAPLAPEDEKKFQEVKKQQ